MILAAVLALAALQAAGCQGSSDSGTTDPGGTGGGSAGGGTATGSGTLADPLVLPVNTAHTDSIASGGSYYVQITTGLAGDYAISLTETNTGLSWSLYTAANETGWVMDCNRIIGFGASDEHCMATGLTATTTYYPVIYEWDFQAGTFTITISDGTAAPVGAIDNPAVMTVNGAAVSGSVGVGGQYFTRFATGAAGDYTLNLTGPTVDMYWVIYADAGYLSALSPFNTCDTANTASDESCAVTSLAGATDYYVEAVAVPDSGPATFSLDVTLP